MEIINEHLKLDIKDTLTHIRFPFTLDRDYEKIIIRLSYDPRLVPEDDCYYLAKDCVDRDMPEGLYSEEAREDAKGARIENFITVSLLYEDKFIGDYHNKNNDQEIIVSKDFASKGYKKFDVVEGFYELILSMHSCNCPVNCDLSLEVTND